MARLPLLLHVRDLPGIPEYDAMGVRFQDSRAARTLSKDKIQDLHTIPLVEQETTHINAIVVLYIYHFCNIKGLVFYTLFGDLLGFFSVCYFRVSLHILLSC